MIRIAAERLWHRLESLLPAPPLQVERIGAGRLVHQRRSLLYTRVWYEYCVGLFRAALRERDVARTVVIGNDAALPFADKDALRIGLQFEHTLVKPGGRDSADAPTGVVPIGDGPERYLVRLANPRYLAALDVIVDYSRPNRANVERSGLHPDYAAKVIELAPLLYPAELAATPRSVPIAALFASRPGDRRDTLLAQLRASGLPVRRFQGVYSATGLRALFRRCAILVNLRQTDHHDTFEELRVLPALLCGVVVVSEDVPLRDSIPYHRHIVWSSRAALSDTVRATHENYAAVRAALFDDGRLDEVLQTMRQANHAEVQRALDMPSTATGNRAG